MCRANLNPISHRSLRVTYTCKLHVYNIIRIGRTSIDSLRTTTRSLFMKRGTLGVFTRYIRRLSSFVRWKFSIGDCKDSEDQEHHTIRIRVCTHLPQIELSNRMRNGARTYRSTFQLFRLRFRTVIARFFACQCVLVMRLFVSSAQLQLPAPACRVDRVCALSRMDVYPQRNLVSAVSSRHRSKRQGSAGLRMESELRDIESETRTDCTRGTSTLLGNSL
jgi:hypothetical protein